MDCVWDSSSVYLRRVRLSAIGGKLWKYQCNKGKRPSVVPLTAESVERTVYKLLEAGERRFDIVNPLFKVGDTGKTFIELVGGVLETNLGYSWPASLNCVDSLAQMRNWGTQDKPIQKYITSLGEVMSVYAPTGKLLGDDPPVVADVLEGGAENRFYLQSIMAKSLLSVLRLVGTEHGELPIERLGMYFGANEYCFEYTLDVPVGALVSPEKYILFSVNSPYLATRSGLGIDNLGDILVISGVPNNLARDVLEYCKRFKPSILSNIKENMAKAKSHMLEQADSADLGRSQYLYSVYRYCDSAFQAGYNIVEICGDELVFAVLREGFNLNTTLKEFSGINCRANGVFSVPHLWVDPVTASMEDARYLIEAAELLECFEVQVIPVGYWGGG